MMIHDKWSSEVPTLYEDVSLSELLKGDNTILMLQTARYPTAVDKGIQLSTLRAFSSSSSSGT